MFSGLLLCSSKIEHRTRVMTVIYINGPLLSQGLLAREIEEMEVFAAEGVRFGRAVQVQM